MFSSNLLWSKLNINFCNVYVTGLWMIMKHHLLLVVAVRMQHIWKVLLGSAVEGLIFSLVIFGSFFILVWVLYVVIFTSTQYKFNNG